jgi:hypothetical protein
MLLHTRLELDFAPYLTANYDQHSSHNFGHQLEEYAELYARFGGLPASFNETNTVIHQLWWNEQQIDYGDLGTRLGMDVITVSTIRQDPGNVLPIHYDTFFLIGKNHPHRREPKVRANIYMQDWQLGHHLEYELDDQWQISHGWRAGDGLIWDSSHLHLSSNAGMSPKYTMQISGFLRQN